ncbi:hypothetical protein QAD02_007999 [Eretmocerus hayati]|uniref:Uncharacterized protein n=1 Tax=Eretmocerus hayati TaxID=131215 RepID=A0ACC2N5J2_9HYME|nr:hypothetical protein QAD02_007999 [Eretmocerus hayati]
MKIEKNFPLLVDDPMDVEQAQGHNEDSSHSGPRAPNNNPTDQLIHQDGECGLSQDEPRQTGDTNTTDQSEEECDKQFVLNLAQFLLKLECEDMVAAKTVDCVALEAMQLHNEAQEFNKAKSLERLSAEDIAEERLESIFNKVFEKDPMNKGYQKLHSSHLRHEFYKEEFDHVQPIFVPIDEEEDTFFAYVPLPGPLSFIDNDKSIQPELSRQRREEIPGLFVDFRDGKLYKDNKYFQENPDAEEIILYEDEFDIVNPVGAAKKHKLLSVYMNVGRVPDHIRSHPSSIELVALCKVSDFDHQKVYGRIVEDLKKIEKGVKVGVKIVKGTVCHICGDNLGSHGLAGHVENFSKAEYFCRYCLISRKEFEKEGGAIKYHPWRTGEMYKRALRNIGNKHSYEGLKFDSKFNDLENFYVSNGLPPCIEHEIFEGFGAFD